MAETVQIAAYMELDTKRHGIPRKPAKTNEAVWLLLCHVAMNHYCACAAVWQIVPLVAPAQREVKASVDFFAGKPMLHTSAKPLDRQSITATGLLYNSYKYVEKCLNPSTDQIFDALMAF